MQSVDIYIRYSDKNVVLDKVATLSLDKNLVFKDEGDNFRALAISTTKFSIITAASPLIGIARLVRSVVFVFHGDLERAGREFIGSLAVPLVASACLLGSLLSCAIFVVNMNEISLYVQMRRIYAYFEAWVNQIDLKSQNLESYSQRASLPTDFMAKKWTTAPCMQPLLENGTSHQAGIFDLARIKKVFPQINIHDVKMEGKKVVLQSEYENKFVHISRFNGACEHARSSHDCCCCYRVDTAYDRVLCVEVGQGNCSSMADSSNTCGFIFCTAGCVGVCCCTEKNNLVAVNTCIC
jgi:hypothetical protein